MGIYSEEEIPVLLDPILGGDYELKTERASCIIEVLNHVDENQKSTVLAYVLKNFGTVEETGEVMKGKRIDENRYHELVEKVGKDIHRAFHLWMKKNPTEEDIAYKVCTHLDQLQDDEERSVALAILLSDRHIPYCKIPEALTPDELGCDVDDAAMLTHSDDYFKRLKCTTILFQNILRRRNLSPATGGIIWDLIKKQETETEKFLLFLTILMMVEKEAKEDNDLGGILGALIGKFGG